MSADVRRSYIPESAARRALLSFGFPEWHADGLTEDYILRYYLELHREANKRRI